MRPLQWVFLLNATLLTLHQIDAAYWQEWQMFRLPGGNQLNLLLNLPIFLLVFGLFRWVILDHLRARLAHRMLAFVGLLAVVIHASFWAAGYAEFRQPASMLILAGTGFLSLWQWVGAGRLPRATEAS